MPEIARRTFNVLLSDGTIQAASVAIHHPEKDDDQDWRCKVVCASPRWGETKTMVGVDALQALYYGVEYAFAEIRTLERIYGSAMTQPEDIED